MKARSAVAWGVLAGVLIMVAAHAGHWFITPHPEASTIRTVMVAVQLVVAALAAVWAWRRGLSEAESDRTARTAWHG